jgi:acetyl-CoA C-acetyltransferase
MPDVIIAGVGQTTVGEHWDISLRDLAMEAIGAARQDAGGLPDGLMPQALFVGNMLAPVVSGQAHLGALIADYAGLRGIEAASVEAAGASGGAALRLGYLAVASGEVDLALVVGVEKMTDQLGSQIEAALANASDADYEASQGLTPSAQAALLMRRYLFEYQVQRPAFAHFAVIAHANGATNPRAMFRRAITPEIYINAGVVSDPLSIFDIAPAADGAAALLLARRELLPPGFRHPLVRISGSALVSYTLALHDRPNPLAFQAAQRSVSRACRQAGILPGDVDLFELHDAYSVFAALSLEAAGFAAPGCGWQLAQEGRIGLRGDLPVATFGGLKARGNPGGATGLYQAVEAVLQLRGQAGANQVAGARRALIQCLGGPASSAATHVLEALEG